MPAHPGDADRPRGWPQTLLVIFPLQGTLCVPSLASDHTGSLFNDEGGFYNAKAIQPCQTSLILKIHVNANRLSNLAHEKPAAILFRD
jgi:hypothetical protein